MQLFCNKIYSYITDYILVHFAAIMYKQQFYNYNSEFLVTAPAFGFMPLSLSSLSSKKQNYHKNAK